jgi:hypothetical protein
MRTLARLSVVLCTFHDYVRKEKNHMKSILGSVAFILFAFCICQAQSVLYFPQFVDGSEGDGVFWVTVIAITNPAGPGTPESFVTIALTQETGAPMKIELWDEGVDPAANPTGSLGAKRVSLFHPAAFTPRRASLICHPSTAAFR